MQTNETKSRKSSDQYSEVVRTTDTWWWNVFFGLSEISIFHSISDQCLDVGDNRNAGDIEVKETLKMN